ncbi:hypothetical protein AB0F30_09620 [Streptomyces sp. NPDC029006]|uniref:hypothetical protein n=1 Tax=Streptomyces sp. NPDC029006 TaxID=3155467 RepID=UPI0033E7D273
MHHHAYLWTGPKARFDREALRRPPPHQPPPPGSSPEARFASEAYRAPGHRAALVTAAVERLGSGGDVSLGFYLERPAFLSLALVGCSPNRTRPELTCPSTG